LQLNISGSTRVAGIIGDPVRYSLSPALHNAAFSALGLDWVYVPFPVADGAAGAAIAGAAALGVAGLSVTMPHKSAAAQAVDRLTPVAEKLGAVNTIINMAGELVGDSTDGAGLVDALRLDDGWEPAGRRCVILGTGGAARAVALALAEAGAASVGVVGRRPQAVGEVVEACGPVGRPAAVNDVAGADLVINATPVGMLPSTLDGRTVGDELPLGLDDRLLRPGQMVVDLVYRPAVTPLVVAARARGATAQNGLGMLIHQAAHQLRAWTGQEPPLAAMSAAALGALAALASTTQKPG
jgi:shikimate dehydrogenase